MKHLAIVFLILVCFTFSLYGLPRELVVVEIASGTWSQYDVGAAMGASELLLNGHQVAIVMNHYGDNFANSYSNARNTYYGISGYPTALFDGLNRYVGGSTTQSMYSNYLPRVTSRLSVQSHFSITANGIRSGNNWNVNVNVSKPEADANTNVVLHACITQSGIPYSWFSMSTVENVNRIMAPSQSGTPINLGTGESTNIPLSFTTDTSWPLEDMEIVFWLQNTTTKEILQGKKYSLADILPTEVTIGAGDQQALVPVDMYWKNSLFECMYFQDELGFVSGSISGVKFYNNFVTDLPNMPINIWLGTTTQTSFAANGWIPSGQLTQVFTGVVNFPTGANTIDITLTSPFNYTGGTLVMMVERVMDTQYYSSSDNFLAQTIGADRALKLYSDSTDYDPAAPPATGATLSGQFPKTTFVYTGQAINNDLGALSVTGNTTPSMSSPWNYVVTIRNNGSIAQSNYTVKLMKEGDVEVGSTPGTAIQPQTNASFTIPWTPTATGPTYLYGKVVLAGDEIPTNNESPHLNVVVQPAGVVAVTVGEGGSTARMPLDMFYCNSLFEAIYLSSELNIGGLLTGIQFYNNFETNLPAMPTNIWVGETTQTDLSADWIPSTQLTQVFTGTVDYPSGANNINIQFPTPYPYGGGNLVVMVERPMDTTYYSSADLFDSQTGTVAARTRNVYSDTVDFNPAAPPTDTPEAIFPRTTFLFSPVGGNVHNYSFNSTLGTYNEISGGTVLGSAANDNEVFNALPLGFDFLYNGVIYNTVSVATNGFVAMGNTVLTSNIPLSNSTGTNNVVAAFSRDIRSRDTGVLRYQSSGTAPNRIFTVQWKHYRRIPTSCANDDFSFQIQLHENGNLVKFVYGECFAVTATTSAAMQVGLRGNDNTDFNNRTTSLDWTATTAGTINTNFCTLSNTVFPPLGLTFTFSPNASGIVSVYGRVVNAAAPSTGVAGATVELQGVTQHSTLTDNLGYFQIIGVSPNTWYDYVVSYPGMISVGDSIFVGSGDYYMGVIELDDYTNPPQNVVAVENGNNVDITWGGPYQENWLTWDTGDFQYGLGSSSGAVQFYVAHRYEQSQLVDFQGGYITHMRFRPCESAASYAVVIWEGGSSAAPGTVVHWQEVPSPNITDWTYVTLNTPVPIPSTGDLYYGYYIDTTTGYPAGVDYGPQVYGYGNKIYWGGAWANLSDLNSSLTYNFMIGAYVTFGNVTRELNAPVISVPEISSFSNTPPVCSPMFNNGSGDDQRSLQGYKVWRLTEGNEANEASWNELTPEPLSLTAFTDSEWTVQPDGNYRWAVKAVYSGSQYSLPSFSNVITHDFVSPVISVAPDSINQDMDVTDSIDSSITIYNSGQEELSWTANLNLRETERTPSVLVWTKYVDIDQEYVNMVAAIQQFAPAATFTQTVTESATELQALLATHPVFIIPEQENYSDPTYYLNLGTTWATALQNYVNSGGKVISCGNNDAIAILTGAGIVNNVVYNDNLYGNEVLSLDQPSHPLAVGIVPPVMVQDATITYTIADPSATIIASYISSAAIWIKDLGAGAVIGLGYDYWEYDTNAAKFIANAVEYQTGNINYAMFPVSGTIPAGGSTLCTLSTTTIDCPPGVYYNQVNLSSNDPVNPLLSMPVTTTVIRYLTPAFSFSPASGNAPLNVQFTDLSTGAVNSWAWDFNNDGTTDATVQNPTWVYNNWGVFSVKLTIGDALGHTAFLLMENCINVLDPYFPIINVSPTSMTADMTPDTTTNQVLTISNTGTEDLNVTLEITNSGTRIASMPMGSAQHNNPGNGMNTGDKQPCISDGMASPGLLSETNPDVIIPNTNRTNPNVILVTALNGNDANFIAGIQSLGNIQSFTTFNAASGTPSYAYLSAFDVILVDSGSYFADNVALGNVLAQCADDGIGVILLQATHCLGGSWVLSGNIMNPSYSPLTAADYLFSSTSCSSFTPHAITQNVSIINSGLYSYSSLQGNALALGYYTSGYPLGALNFDKPVISINLYPYDGYWSGDLIQLVSNSISWLHSRNWLSTTPTTATIPPGGNTQITVTFNSAGMINGTYHKNINISSNDPDTPLLTVPVTLNVFEALNPPTNVAATAGNNLVNISWTAPVTRSLQGYQVWRLQSGQEANEASWTPLTPTPITTTTFTDNYPLTLTAGNYKWAVKALYSGGMMSAAALSNQVYLAMEFPEIALSTTALTADLLSGESSQQTFTISNTGELPLDFNIAELSRALRAIDPGAGITLSTQRIESAKGDSPEAYQVWLAEHPESGSDLEASSGAPTRVLDWLSEDPLMGTIPPLGSMQINVTFNTVGLSAGAYLGQLQISSNDPLNPIQYVNVSLGVTIPNFTTIDNENNAHTGVPDNDLDVYLFNDDSLHPIEFNIFVSNTTFSTAQLAVLAWDVDETSGEVDHAYLNGHFLGALTGANSQWSTSVFEVNPAWVVAGPNGQNLVQIYVDINDDGWATTIDWGQMIFPDVNPDVQIRYVALADSVYTTGMSIGITQELDTNLSSYSILVETNILDPNGINVDGASNSYTIHGNNDDAVMVQRSIPAGSLYGTYQVQTLVYDADHNLLYDAELTPFQVIQPGPKFVFDPPSLNLGTVYVSDTLSVAIEISNIGYNQLNISSLNIPNAAFNLSGSTFAIPRMQSRELIITYRPTVAATLNLNMQVASNDISTPNYGYPISVNSLLYPAPLYSNILPEQLNHDYLNYWQVMAQISFADTMIVDAGTLQYRFDKNGNGSYDATEPWTAIVGYASGPQIDIVQALSWRRDGDHLCFEFRAQNMRHSGWRYTGTGNAEGIADDFYVRLDASGPTWIDYLAVTASTLNSVSLQWSEAYDPRFESYEIYYATHGVITDADSKWDNLNDPALAAITTTATTITGLSPGETYYFAIRGRDSVGNYGVFSDEVSALTGAADMVQNAHIVLVGTSALLSWDAYPGAFQYLIYHAPYPEGPWTLINTTSQLSIAIDTTAGMGFYRVSASGTPVRKDTEN